MDWGSLPTWAVFKPGQLSHWGSCHTGAVVYLDSCPTWTVVQPGQLSYLGSCPTWAVVAWTVVCLDSCHLGSCRGTLRRPSPTIINHHDLPLTIMINRYQSQAIINHQDLPLTINNHHDLPLTIMSNRYQSQAIINHHDLPLTIMSNRY